jgi:hypothetical protein
MIVKLFNHVHILHQTPENMGIANEVIAGHIDNDGKTLMR